MNIRGKLKRLTSAGVLALVTPLGGCSHGAASNAPAVAPAEVLADIAAFRAKPNDATWEAVHNGLVGNPAAQDSQSSLINAVTKTDVPRKYIEAAAIDLTATDYQGSIRWIRFINLGAQADPSPDARQTVRRSALLAWLMLALRSGSDTNGVEMTHMDLRSGEPFVGQAANFDNVDFSQAILSGGAWRYVNLTDARFDGVRTTQPLTCTNCFWGKQEFAGRMALQGGIWTVP